MVIVNRYLYLKCNWKYKNYIHWISVSYLKVLYDLLVIIYYLLITICCELIVSNGFKLQFIHFKLILELVFEDFI